jgi:hypothetical protein
LASSSKYSHQYVLLHHRPKSNGAN